MSLSNGHAAWSKPPLSHTSSSRSLNHFDDSVAQKSTPADGVPQAAPEAPGDAEDENRRALFTDLFRKTEDRVSLLFGSDGLYNRDTINALWRRPESSNAVLPPATDHEPITEPPSKRAKRTIDEDDYDDDEDDEDDSGPSGASAEGPATSGAVLPPSKPSLSPAAPSPDKSADKSRGVEFQNKDKKDEGTMTELDKARLATEEAARRSFHTIFYTLENDRTAMLEQQQLEDSEKQLQAEMDHSGNSTTNGAQTAGQGSLASANLGASSLTLKHLIARIDYKRDQVAASDAELRLLMNEVRKNRSKWASEENVNQEELYEALEKVLTELKAHTEYSTPFLTRVNKRDAPDYYLLIKNPMDLGTMTKKLKSLTYKSKTDFVGDLNLIWDNCLRYNQDMNHPLRRLANGMRKEAEKLIPLIPDLVIRSRAEVEAEERRKQNGGEDDAGDDSDDEPIMSSRGRKAATKGANKSRKAPSDQKEDTPVVDQKPVLQLNGLLGKAGREGSEAVDGSNGFSTPPIGGSGTPILNGQSGSNADAMDVDGPSLNGMALNQAFDEAAEQVFESEEYKLWKQTTKKDRANVAKEHFLLFKDKKMNPDNQALLRSKAGMRWFLKHRKEAEARGIIGNGQQDDANAPPTATSKQPETLADGIEEEEDQVIPDYYRSLSIIPEIPVRLQWTEDNEGQVINHHEDFLQLVPEGTFVAPRGRFAKKMDDNIHQIQETRKLANKITVIKQMQVQTQVYTNQFPKSNADAFVEQDIDPHFISDGGPVMAAQTCQNALKRSIAKILYNSGFEELQPSAIDTFTGVAEDYFHKLMRTFNVYCETEKKTVHTAEGDVLQPRFTPEEVILHTLDENGHDVASLEAYARDDVERLNTKLGGLHDRMKTHLTDLLRPALTGEAGADGAGAFKDGSDQFTSGDFADELGEDFFGFKALGLDKEMGLDSFSVPFHLLQSRVRNQYQMQTQTVGTTTLDLFEEPPALESVTKENIQDNIGLVKNFFLAKLHANGDSPLIEDEDLPTKQKKPRPRLGASGKIVSAQKRPPKEQLALAKKKKKLEAQAADAKANNAQDKGKGGAGAGGKENNTPSKKKMSLPNGAVPNPALLALAPSMERADSMQSGTGASQTDGGDGMGMMSPESIVQ